jgi:hypothetical protein
MRLIRACSLTLISLIALLLLNIAYAGDFKTGMLAGYNGGGGIRGTLMVSNFAQGFPLSLEAGLGYSWRDGGDPEAARHIFINDNTNGTPEESAWVWDLRLDFHYKASLLGLRDGSLFVGPRYSMFTADFKYVGGNEDFEVTSNQWGIGVGGKATFPISQRVGFTLLAGVDYFFASTLEGHDTAYSPDGSSVNGREGYSYSDADAAINQPKFQPVLMIGLSYGL